MKIIIDGKQIEVNPNDKNIVDIADRNNIPIAALCYRAQKAKGCCKSCIVEINGEKNYACGTKPLEGMKININREDLSSLKLLFIGLIKFLSNIISTSIILPRVFKRNRIQINLFR